MNKKRILNVKKLCLALCLAVLTVSFTSCQKNYQKLTGINIEPANGMAVLYFYLSEGDVSLLQVSIDPLPKEESYPKYIIPAGRVCYYWLKGLENEKKYTVRVDNLDDNYKIISTQTAQVTPTAETFVFEYKSKEEPFVEVPADTNLVTLKNVKDKFISFASLNVGNKAIPPIGQRLLVDNLNLENPRSALPEQEKPSVEKQETRFETPFVFHEWQNTQAQAGSSRSAAPGTQDNSDEKNTFDITNAKVGNKRTIYLDNSNETFKSGSNDSFEPKEVTLLGIGKDGSKIKCLVWVENNCISPENKCSGKMVNAQLAQKLADTFVDYYLHVTDIAGSESNFISMGNNRTSPMSEQSKTGEAVNIVLYDIGNDYENPERETYMGYFHPKDYWEVSTKTSSEENISNCGKYIYLDTPTCNISYNDNGKPTYQNGNKDDKADYIPSGRAVSTLMHEFQHLIYYGTKNGCTWYTEMFSMLLEDILYEDLVENYNIRREDSSRARLWEFNCGYLWDWTNNTFSYEAYAPTYAFGAWLVRNHGGIQLIKQMYEESEVGCDGIVKAVNDLNLNGTQYEWKDLLEQFLTACAVYTNNLEETNLPTFNRTSGETVISHNHTSCLLPLDLYSDDNTWYDYNGTTEWRGPIWYTTNYNEEEIPPSSFMLRNGFVSREETVMLLFTRQVQPTKDYNEEFFIYIQEKFNNYVEK